MDKTAVNLVSAATKEKVENLAREAVETFKGLELVEVAFKNEYSKLNLYVYIWKREGIEFSDCEAVHNLLSDKLDAIEDEFPINYVLNVSSSGLDRKIVSDDDFRRALGTEIEVVINNKDKPHGILKEYDNEKFTIITSGKKPIEKVIERNTSMKVQPYIRF